MIITFVEFINLLKEGSVGFYKHEVPSYSVNTRHNWVYNKIGGFFVCPVCDSTKKRVYFGQGKSRTSKDEYMDSFGNSVKDMPECNPINKQFNPNIGSNIIRQKRSEDEISKTPIKSWWEGKKKEDTPKSILRKKPEDIDYFQDIVNDYNLSMKQLNVLYNGEKDEEKKSELWDELGNLAEAEIDLNRLKKKLISKYQDDEEFFELIKSIKID